MLCTLMGDLNDQATIESRSVVAVMENVVAVMESVVAVMESVASTGEQRAWIRCTCHEGCFKYRQVNQFSNKKVCAAWLCAWSHTGAQHIGSPAAVCPTQADHKKNPPNPEYVQQFEAMIAKVD